MSYIFDGKKFAKEREELLAESVKFLKKRKIKPRITSILVGNDKASKIYLNLKKKSAEKVGIEMDIVEFEKDTPHTKIIKLIKKLNVNKSVHGIMVQLPLPESLSKHKDEILNSIKKQKDIDGLRDKSLFSGATSLAVSSIVSFAIKPLAYVGKKATVIGANGTVGKGVCIELKKLGFKITGCDQGTRDLYAKIHEADLVVSATGVLGLIKAEMVKEGVIAIDCGAPKPEFDFDRVSKKASFITPVPGGVGPVTIVALMENLVKACSKD
ncbi:bifunctional 5,10-methylenetetrahydrofolate dehydrogenase/5,10-methenyltetrahydrofolate cyclohydrolase [Candidatus Woesebacteria bacterium]|nr:bifunctional 5,10-methylenetetrahydrofolate dehydrogenase/5,10-methenyltetrahydrofolate cyclohydrolase [Candidatus Woesebacteria bacterium]QQG47395.1 MAG: bifunctional 5,10-methylenetetrahydrofolate dehydrogenase/5,10-methenyltetrahydrofolate cyclohydrolase [Candidatus Woesebacteria bacterium]